MPRRCRTRARHCANVGFALAEKLRPGYRTKQGAEMPDWVAVAHLPSFKVRHILRRWLVEAPRAIMPNRQRTMHSFHTAAGTWVPSVPAPFSAQAAAPAATAPNPGHANESERNSADAITKNPRD